MKFLNKKHDRWSGHFYHYTSRDDFIWFLVPKAASRTIHALFKQTDFEFPKEERKELPESLSSYYSFSFVRNPFERILSCYQQKIIEQTPTRQHIHTLFNYREPCFKDFVKIVLKNENINKDAHWDTIHNLIPVKKLDFIGRVENLQRDMNYICDKIGIPQRELLHKNKTKHKHYTKYYDDETRQIVAEKYAKDIKYFGYKFGE